MIRRRRGPEPPELVAERARRVAQGISNPGARQTGVGYGPASVREALRRVQAGRCAYCATRTVESTFDAVEHYRPRNGYWWLTWTWQNLWLACTVCQGKSNKFPVEAGTTRLDEPTAEDMQTAFALSAERPMLLDPARDTPQDHLCVEEIPGTGGGWFWAAVPGSERGLETIGLLHLDRRTRTADYERLKQHIGRRLVPAVAEVEAALDCDDVAGARAAWHRCADDFLWRRRGPNVEPTEADHLVPSWWYLNAAFDRLGLAAHGLAMWPYPDDGEGPPPDPDPGVTLALGVDVALQDRLLVSYVSGFGTRVPACYVEAALEGLCRARPSTVDELANDLNRKAPTINRYVRRLVSAGRLVKRGERYGPPLTGDQ